MTRDEFFSLPAAIGLRVLFDCLDEGAAAELARKEKPVAPKPPKYDQIIYRQGGMMFASETDIDGLRFWHKRAAESAASGGQYADKDKKNAETLARWIAWREWFPEATWSGERNRDLVVAKPPSAKPTVYPRASNGGGQRPQSPPPDSGFDPTDEIPF